MARRPKRTYNQETGQWEVESFYDSQDDQGRYWKDGVQVDSSGRPWQETEDKMIKYYETNENTSTPGTGVGGGKLPEVGDQSIDTDDPRNIIMGSSTINLMTGEDKRGSRGKGLQRVGGSVTAGSSALRRSVIEKKRFSPSLITGKS